MSDDVKCMVWEAQLVAAGAANNRCLNRGDNLEPAVLLSVRACVCVCVFACKSMRTYVSAYWV